MLVKCHLKKTQNLSAGLGGSTYIYICFGTAYLREFVIVVLVKVMSQIGKHVVAVQSLFSTTA